MAATNETHNRLAKVYAKLRKQRDVAMKDAITDRNQIVDLAHAPIKALILKSADLVDALVRFYIETMLPDSARPRADRSDRQYTFFNLLDSEILHYPGAPLFKYRGKFTLFDLDQATRQKEDNFRMVGFSLQKWRWEVSIIRPLLVANPHWLYEDAYTYLIEHGGLPRPPEFERPPRRKTGT